jgi:hypothetical protein
VGGEMNIREWGEPIEARGRDLPLVLHFRPQEMVEVREDMREKFRELLRENIGLVPEGDKTPWGPAAQPQGTISGSGDGWDDCDN